MQKGTKILLRRLASAVYDSILVTAILLITSLPWVMLGIVPGHAYYPTYTIFIYAVITFYFTWFWINGGQTPAMRTWHLQVISDDDNPISLYYAWIRLTIGLLTSIVGLALALFDKDKRTCYDKLSKSHIIMTDA